jgi:hypothetical protein
LYKSETGLIISVPEVVLKKKKKVYFELVCNQGLKNTFMYVANVMVLSSLCPHVIKLKNGGWVLKKNLDARKFY